MCLPEPTSYFFSVLLEYLYETKATKFTWKSLCVIYTFPGSRFWNFGREDWEPSRTGGSLLLELSSESILDRIQSEYTYSRAMESRADCCENCIKSTVISGHSVDRLCTEENQENKSVTMINCYL